MIEFLHGDFVHLLYSKYKYRYIFLSSSQGQSVQTMNLQKQVSQLQMEVGESKSLVAKQEAVIHALREVSPSGVSRCFHSCNSLNFKTLEYM